MLNKFSSSILHYIIRSLPDEIWLWSVNQIFLSQFEIINHSRPFSQQTMIGIANEQNISKAVIAVLLWRKYSSFGQY